jgi:hypothetical protein
LYARSHANEPVAMPQQNLQIALPARRHPDRRETIFRQQLEKQAGISAVIFLLARFGRPDFRGVTDPVFDFEFFE